MLILKKSKNLFVKIQHKTKNVHLLFKRTISIFSWLKACHNSLVLYIQSKDRDVMLFYTPLIITLIFLCSAIKDLNDITDAITNRILRYYGVNSIQTASIIYYTTAFVVYTTYIGLNYTSIYFFIKLSYSYRDYIDEDDNTDNAKKSNNKSFYNYLFTKQNKKIKRDIHPNFKNLYYGNTAKDYQEFAPHYLDDNLYCQKLRLKMENGLITLVNENLNNKCKLNLDLQNMEDHRLDGTSISSNNSYKKFLQQFQEYKKFSNFGPREIQIEHEKIMSSHFNDLNKMGFFDDFK
jgi:hypothetical protein